MEFLIGIYACLFLFGVLGNGSLGTSLCCGSGPNNRHPLLLGIIAADLLVCGISGPLTATLYSFNWDQPMKNFVHVVQTWPVSASTLSMMAISIDRFLTVKNYRLVTSTKRKRTIFIIIIALIWTFACILSVPHLLPKYTWTKTLHLVVTIFIHVIPAIVVMGSHIGVHLSLTAVSLTARAQHGELPLPMPLLRRPTNVIIVAGMTKAQSGIPPPAEENDIEDETQPSNSTLESRRRLANSLLWVAILFTLFWMPHVVCQICDAFDVPVSEDVQRYSLLLGHFHSALSPILYCAVNHQWLNRPCKFNMPVLNRSPSSTNEAALGPFNPRFARPPPIRRHSSHNFY